MKTVNNSERSILGSMSICTNAHNDLKTGINTY